MVIVNSYSIVDCLNHGVKAAKGEYISSPPIEEVDQKRMEALRCGSIVGECYRLARLVCKNVDDFVEVRDDILKIINKIEMRRHPCKRQYSFDQTVGDLDVVKTKGAPLRNTVVRRGESAQIVSRQVMTIEDVQRLLIKMIEIH